MRTRFNYQQNFFLPDFMRFMKQFPLSAMLCSITDFNRSLKITCLEAWA